MEKRIFVLYDSDSRYVERFLEYVGRRQAFPFRTMGFTRWEELEAGISGQKAAVFLVEKRAWQEFDEAQRHKVLAQAGYLCLLCQERESESEGIPSIYRYQSLEGILRSILAGVEESAPVSQGGTHRTQFVAVYSPVGRCFKTTCAVVLGQILAEKEAVLYVNLEAISGACFLGEREAGRSLSDLLYLRRLSGGERRRLHSITETLGKLELLSPVVNPEDIWDISGEELRGVLEEIGQEDSYDTVIVDVGVGKNPLPLLGLCRRILIPVREDRISVRRMEEFKEYLRRCGEEDILAVCREVAVPEYAGLREGCGDYRQLRYSALGQFLEKEWTSW